MRTTKSSPEYSHDAIESYRNGLIRRTLPQRPSAFLSNLNTKVPIEFVSNGTQHHFNLQLIGCVETYRVWGKREIKRLVVPGHASFTPASEHLRVWVQPVCNAQALHCTLPVKWMDEVREREIAISARRSSPELQPEMGLWSTTLLRPAMRIVDALSVPNEMQRLQMDSLFLELAVKLWQADRPVPELLARERLSFEKLKAVIDYLNDNLSSDVTLQELADVSQLTAYHFARAFRAAVGISPWRYFCALRICTARRWLISCNLTVTELALRLGYNSSSHFGSAFRAATGMTPSAFRTMMK